MARPRTVSDEQILTAARRLIRTHGPQVSVDAIAAEVGVSGQAVLKRFGSRDQLLVETLRPPPVPAFLTALDEGPDGRPFAEQLAEISVATTALVATQAQDFAALRWSSASIRDVLVPPGTTPAPMTAVHRVSAWLRRCVDRRLVRDDVDADATALALLGALQARSLFTHLFDQPPIEAGDDSYVSAVVDMFARALSPLPLAPLAGRGPSATGLRVPLPGLEGPDLTDDVVGGEEGGEP